MTNILRPTVRILILSLVAAGASAAAGLKFWWAFMILGIGIIINGWVATLEDDLPGGFNNPDGKNTPRYAVVTGWVVRIIGGILLLLCMAALALFYWG